MSTQTILDSLYAKMGRFAPGQRTAMRQLVTDLYATKTIVDADTVTLAAIAGDAAPDAVVPTVGGGTTGLIPANAQFIDVTSADATHQISLPAATIGKTIRGFVGTNGCEVISVVAADKINNVVVGATNEAALPASTFFVFTYTIANNWILTTYSLLGEVNVDGTTPVVPDIL